MLLIKLQKNLSNFNDKNSVKKLEKVIIKTLYNSNIGPDNSGIEDYQLKHTNDIFKFVSSDYSFKRALSNLKLRNLIEYTSPDNQIFQNIKLTNIGVEYCYQNKDNKFIKYLKKNHLAIIAIIVSIIALFKS